MRHRKFVISAAILALLGGSAWLLISEWQRRAPVDAVEAEAMALQSSLNTEVMQRTLNEQLVGSTDDERQQRMSSELGLALFRRCVEWTELNDNHPDINSSDNVQRACDEYRHYVETGQIPD